MKKIHKDRIHFIKDTSPNENGNYVLYWITNAFREHWNYSLEYAIGKGEESGCGVVALIVFEQEQEIFNKRHLNFILQGIEELEKKLKERSVKLVLRVGSTVDNIRKLSTDAMMIVTDFPYLSEERKRLSLVKKNINIPITALENNVVVPVQTVSDKKEYAARTIRPKIMDLYQDYLQKPVSSDPVKSTKRYSIDSIDVNEIIARLEFTESVDIVESFQGGWSHAKQNLENFLSNKLGQYDEDRNKPKAKVTSNLSMYLCHGFIAPAYIVSRILNKKKSKNSEAFLEELIVRRELAINFVYYEKNYTGLKALPDWAFETLEKHKSDKRETIYTRKELEDGETSDEVWNECMMRMKNTGYLHNYMRMYWGKKIISWTNTPSFAHQVALYLNNKYFLDGNDANSFANILWLFGLHDRAWQENPVYGKVRIMKKSGLKRKIDIENFLNNR